MEEKNSNVNIGAEQSILGALLLDGGKYIEIGQKLHQVHFYQISHRLIYKAIQHLAEKAIPIDIVTVAQTLRDNNDYEQSGGTAYLTDLVAAIPTAAHISHHADIVIDLAFNREKISTMEKIVSYQKSGLNTEELELHLIKLTAKHKGKIIPRKNIAKSSKNPDDFASKMQELNKYKYMEGVGFFHWLQEGYWQRLTDLQVENHIVDLLRSEGWPVSVSLCGQILKIMKIDCRCDHQVSDKRYINFKNCIIDIDRKMTIEHSPEIFTTYQIPVIWRHIGDLRGVAFDNEYWLTSGKQTHAFLEDITLRDPEMMRLIQQIVGSCLVADTKYQAAFFFHGKGSNGKSVLFKMIENLVGLENKSSVTFKGLDERFSRSALYNKLVNISSETEFGTAMNMEIFKQVVTGDSISAEFKGKDVFSFRPFAKMIFACNEFPIIKERSYAFWRRINIVPCDAIFSGDNLDRDMEKKLMEEMEAFAYWAVFGMFDLIGRGEFIRPKRSIERLEKIQHEASTVLSFSAELLQPEPDAFIESDKLYEMYSRYCSESGYRPLARMRFENELMDSFASVKRSARFQAKGLKGIRVKSVMNFPENSFNGMLVSEVM